MTKNTVMNKESLLAYLRQNKTYLNISAIGRAAGFTRLLRVVNEYKDGHGTTESMPDKYVKPVNEIISALQKK